ncbi:MAG: nucleotidyl transferase AbiEii/AbiGii toxin family protein [Bacteroidales bacterium]|nr:nucleotidyl transferase AbiEii/AbiGii toxin family protein [Bacteroidales bacterium]MDD3431923.1 nucleotidyl transferase AbiEii/AbiGii toxin family protein [Bacteroidales bacterium]MDD4361729.1 nucleotidyl transferase AbiEii/AbiGii toxin family protein [Bacteroidales bacterium]MDD4431560.1 nucleotidyl transferase AbiEii/AbiGii toxin family protein [Bacteroidales bacterium]
MLDINKHKLYLFQILKEIYENKELGGALGFKGGTALMFFFGLPRFSVDLDFNLLCPEKEDIVYEKLRNILINHGTIHDEAKKFFGIICVLDYGKGERKLKVEISNRNFSDKYEIKNLLGINVQVMTAPDMFAHKLCAILDRNTITNRDIFDCWWFMNNKTALNKTIVETRMQMPLADYLQECINILEKMSDKGILNGLGELMSEDLKKVVRTKLRTETISFLKFYKEYPILL